MQPSIQDKVQNYLVNRSTVQFHWCFEAFAGYCKCYPRRVVNILTLQDLNQSYENQTNFQRLLKHLNMFILSVIRIIVVHGTK